MESPALRHSSDIPGATTDVYPYRFPKLEFGAVVFSLQLGCDEAQQVFTSEKKALARGIVNGSLVLLSQSTFSNSETYLGAIKPFQS